eukprot:5727980-Prymnesium_polylepis.1
MSESPCLKLEGRRAFPWPNTRRHPTHQLVSEPKVFRNNPRIDCARCSSISMPVATRKSRSYLLNCRATRPISPTSPHAHAAEPAPTCHRKALVSTVLAATSHRHRELSPPNLYCIQDEKFSHTWN